MSKPKYLEPVYWVHVPHALRPTESEAEDLCPTCCDRRVEALRAKWPAHAEGICADGGYETCRESETLAACADCGDPLACGLIGDEWAGMPGIYRAVRTAAQWSRAASWQHAGDPAP